MDMKIKIKHIVSVAGKWKISVVHAFEFGVWSLTIIENKKEKQEKERDWEKSEFYRLVGEENIYIYI